MTRNIPVLIYFVKKTFDDVSNFFNGNIEFVKIKFVSHKI